MNTVEKLKEELIKADNGLKEIINIDKDGKYLHLNCDNHQALFVNKDNKFEFATVGGSRFFYLEKFSTVDECVKFCINTIVYKTNEQIDNEYRAIFNAMKAGV